MSYYWDVVKKRRGWVHTHKRKNTGGHRCLDRWAWYDEHGIARLYIQVQADVHKRIYLFRIRDLARGWECMPGVRRPAEAKATALAIWRME